MLNITRYITVIMAALALLLSCVCHARIADLFDAIHSEDKNAVVRILDSGVSVDSTRGEEKITALHDAVLVDSDEIVDILLQRQCNVYARDTKSGGTAAHWAASYGYLQPLAKIIQAGYAVDYADRINGYTALQWAVSENNYNIAEYLVNQGADIDYKSSIDGVSALHLVSKYGSLECAILLINAGAEVDATTNDGGTPLLYASCFGNTDIVNELLRAGASVNEADLEGITPLHWAANGHDEIVRLLISQDADVNAIERKFGKTPLIQAAKYGFAIIVRMLVEAGADLSIEDADGLTAEEWAVRGNHQDVIQVLRSASGSK